MELLIVDDDIVDQEFIIRSLGHLKKGISKIHTADSVNQALSIIKVENLDMILLDYRMPERDGIEMLKTIKSDQKLNKTAIVMMSTSEDSQLAIDCIKSGAQDFLVKSEITVDRLQRAMLHADARFELEKQLADSFQKVKQLAERDSLTKLCNRYLFEETLKNAVAANKRNNYKLALILIDLDNFKFVNDTYGHADGDEFLVKFVDRISSQLRDNEMFARLGGDEFALVLPNLEKINQASIIVKRLLNSLSSPLTVNNRKLPVSASFGVAIHPDNTTTASQLYQLADIALYRAKHKGKGQICFFEASMQEVFSSKFIIENEIRYALDNDEFLLYFQPIFNPLTMQLVCFEALIRWQHSEGMRFPDQFIPIAEESSYMDEIGLWVFKKAFSVISDWNNRYNCQFSIAINISPTQLTKQGFVDDIESIRQQFNLSSNLIELELTETVLLTDVEETKQQLTKLKSKGYKIALDDFGTGFSSISHLQNFPIDTVKIDKSLLLDKQSEKDVNLFNGLVTMLSALKLEVVAEGVEVEESLTLCKKNKVDRVQGYFFSKPDSQQVIEDDFIAKYS